MASFSASYPGALAATLALAVLSAGAGSASAAAPDLYALTIAVGDAQTTANDVLFDGKYIWVAVQTINGGAVEKLTENGTVLSTTGVGIAPLEMAYDGKRIWVTNYVSSSISIIDQQGQLVNTIYLPTGAHAEGIFFDGKYIWTGNNGLGFNDVSKFDPATMTLIANYPVGLTPDSIAFDGTDIWVTNPDSNNVMKLNRETGEILRTYPTGIFPTSIVFDGKDMWIANGDSASPGAPALATASLTKLRVAGGVNLGTFASGNAVRGMVDDGTSIWACNGQSNTVTRVRISDGAHLGTYPTGANPRGIAFDGERLWIANSGANTLTILSQKYDPIVLRAGIGFYIPPVLLEPTLLAPVALSVPGLAAGATAIKPRATPGVAGLASILDGLLEN